jgi:hypothetical protein
MWPQERSSKIYILYINQLVIRITTTQKKEDVTIIPK